MKQLYYQLNELLKSYYVFCAFDMATANTLLVQINDLRLQIAVLADQRQIFIDQFDIPADASGYQRDFFFTHDDIDSIVTRGIAYLDAATKTTLVQQGTRENYFTRQPVAWQHLFSDVQRATPLGQQIPFDFPQDIYLQKAETLDIGVQGQVDLGFIFIHGANLPDNILPNKQNLLAEINLIEIDGRPNLPKPQLIPIQFKFTANATDNAAVAVDGAKDIYSIRNSRSVILTEVSCTVNNMRTTLIDKGRDNTICESVDIQGIAGYFEDAFTVYYPLPYPYLLRGQDRIQFKALNGGDVNTNPVGNTNVQTLCFRGYTL